MAGSKSRWPAVITIGVIVLAVTAWLLVAYFGGRPTKTPGTLTNVTPRVQDITTTPSGWASPINLDLTDSASYPVIDTGVDSIIIVASPGHITALDLGGRKVLWQVAGATYWVTFDDATGLISNSENTFYRINIRTGKTTKLGTLPSGDRPVYAAGDVVISDISEVNPGGVFNYCARKLSDPGNCLWQATWFSGSEAARVFGDGRWINTDNGVYDIAAGEPASFGAAPNTDANQQVFFAGPADHVLKITINYGDKTTTTLQPWDTLADKALSQSVTTTGILVPDSYTSSALLMYSADDRSVAAYSWSTGWLLWRSQVGVVTNVAPNTWVFDSCIQVLTQSPDGQPDPGPTQTAVLDSASGRELWRGSTYRVVQSSDKVVYMDGNALFAFDTTMPGFHQLWSVAAPATGVEYHVLAHHIVALSRTTGQLWVLNY